MQRFSCEFITIATFIINKRIIMREKIVLVCTLKKKGFGGLQISPQIIDIIRGAQLKYKLNDSYSENPKIFFSTCQFTSKVKDINQPINVCPGYIKQ